MFENGRVLDLRRISPYELAQTGANRGKAAQDDAPAEPCVCTLSGGAVFEQKYPDGKPTNAAQHPTGAPYAFVFE